MRYLIAVLFAVHAFAQSATLRGQVTDESGAIVPGARVTLAPAARNTTANSTTADSTAAYAFTVPPGDYTVQASAPGLSQPEPVRIALRAGLQTLNLTLRVAVRTDQVTVNDNAGPAVSIDNNSNASALVLRGEDLQALSDNPDDLAADLQALAGPSAGPNGGSIFVDGFSGGQLPPKESIREIRINQNPFSPEYDKLGLGRIEIFTKPGSDKYRGTAQWNFAHDFWNSRNPYSPQKAPFLLNELEGNGGGPLGRHASFTLDAQRNMVDNGSITNGVTLDPATFAIRPFASVFTIPGRFTNVSPRVDYQLNDRNTLMFRYGITHSDVRDNGIGGFELISRAYHSQFTNQTVQAADTVVIGSTINETRFQFYRSATQALANSADPAIQVLGSFNGGGSSYGRTFDAQNSFELQNYTSTLRRAHAFRFGVRLRAQTDDSDSPQNFNGTFTFGGGDGLTSIERYRRTLLHEPGFGPTQFSINAGTPQLSVHQVDAGIFAGDEWRVRTNLTLSLGIRYEAQTNMHDWRDIAPRVAIAWAPRGSAKNSRPRTVIRAGVGMFYDRFALSGTLAAHRFNGIVQQQYVVDSPGFFPSVPSLQELTAFRSTQITEQVDSHLRAPYIVQSVATLERQLAANLTLAVTYSNSHGLHIFRSSVLPRAAPVFLRESSGLYNQNQVIANVNAKLKAGLSLFGFYVFNRAMSNSDGINTFPANPRDYAGEYGPASTDVRHRVTIGGSINLKWNVRISPFAVLQSGAPFDITAGRDLYGTTLFNGRPGIAADSGKTGLVRTKYGLLDPNPTPGEALLPRNYGRGPGQINMNLRLAKTIGLGAERGSGAADPRPAAGGSTATAAAITGRGMGGLIGNPTTAHRVNLTIGLSIRNLLNHTNPGPIVGNIASPLFGFANQVAGGPNGEGFYENANNRRLESQIKLTF